MAKTKKLITQSKTEQERLIAKLEPNLDYGWREFEWLADHIRGGDIVITEGNNLPVLKDRWTGYTIKGSGRPITQQTRRDNFKKQFDEVATAKIGELIEALIQRAINGDTKASMYVLDRLLGKDTERLSGVSDDPIFNDLEIIEHYQVFNNRYDASMERQIELDEELALLQELEEMTEEERKEFFDDDKSGHFNKYKRLYR